MEQEIKLTNFDIKDMIDSRGRTYYLIIDSNTTDGYFCFTGKVKEGWDLITKIPGPSELVIEYETIERGGKTLRRVTKLREGWGEFA